MIITLYLLAIMALVIGTAAIYMALVKAFPVQWLYYHYRLRKPLVWLIFGSSLVWVLAFTWQRGVFPIAALLPLLLMGLAIVLTYRMHQEHAFPADDFPPSADDPFKLPLTDDMQLAVIEYQGVTRAYPLGYVIHHHIVNDRFGEATVALTYCAMCRTIIPFDVTDIGPLFVGSFKNANMIVADRRTGTFFQQATFESIIGKLHPHTLTMIPVQILSWRDVRQLQPLPQLVEVTERDFREFELPIPGVWRRIIASEATPGLPATERDKTFPARTHVIGVIDESAGPEVVYVKDELLQRGVVKNEKLDVILVAVNDTVNGYKAQVQGRPLNISLTDDSRLIDGISGTVWNLRGKHLHGELAADLEPVALSDEYWFSWQRFHPGSELIRM